ncbi:unnamed protein product [Thlaspi arvense]|uniref:FKB95-like N-terminal Kelch domain-containing protein n=1 Tax=Thlaspi arvense TaxID=13288 RepID=A0AAU9S1J4_THLAR|nr:unnamed protein product [Thlaspi arvense]
MHKGRWRAEDLALNSGWLSVGPWCVIQNVFFRFYMRKIEWYDSKNKVWIPLKGLETLLPRLAGVNKVTDYGGKMVILWQEPDVVSDMSHQLWCAEIAIEKRQKGEIWGILEWFDIVSSASGLLKIDHALTTII